MRYYVPILVTGMLLTGAANSLWTKWQDMQCVEDCDNQDPKKHVLYEQPVWQTLQMFLGEMLCFLPVLIGWLRTRSKPALLLVEEERNLPSKPIRTLGGARILLLWIPALCDLTGTTLMNIGLLYTPVSIYQMTRGALVLFVGVFSVVFLRRRLWLLQWLSLLTVMLGVALVGYSGSLVKETLEEGFSAVLYGRAVRDTPRKQPEAATQVLIGIFFILFAQCFTATQFVVEEMIMGKYSVAPLVAVGFEGLFGTISILLLIPILSIPAISSKSPFLDLPRGWRQMIDTPAVLWSGVIIAISIAAFNFFGLSLTRHVSATMRSLTDTCRTLVIWIVSLVLGWEVLLFPVSLLQVLGFSLLVYGTFAFNDLVQFPFAHRLGLIRTPPNTIAVTSEEEGLLENQEDSLTSTALLPADLGLGGFDVEPRK